ncbi:MAG TPA: EAL domain-containing protein [Stellaceae bacterium]|nr:EAL domain-containing protein [Stellaceae bacterium]
MTPRSNVLILDDDVELRSLLAEGLQDHGHDCRIVADPAEIDPANWRWAGVVIVDLQLGHRQDGASVLRRMVGVLPRPRLALVSGFDDMVLNTAARAASDLGYEVIDAIPKPVAIHTLVERFAGVRPSGRRNEPSEMMPLSADQLRSALDRGEIGAAFQPKINLLSGACVGVEVLARWQSTELGAVSPASFIPLAEETGLIDRLTDDITEQALAAAAAWAVQGCCPTLAINLSGCLLDDPALVDRLEDRVARHGLASSQIILELTETVAVALRGRALETATRLRLAGYGLSLDDFGTGENRFERLIGLPLTELKLDKLFTEAVVTPHGLRVARGIVALAHTLGMTCVAEGVEHPEQARVLREVGCDLGQGWHLGRPVPAATILTLLPGADIAR